MFKVGDIIRSKRPYLFEGALKIAKILEDSIYVIGVDSWKEWEKTKDIKEVLYQKWLMKYEIKNYKKVWFKFYWFHWLRMRLCCFRWYLQEPKEIKNYMKMEKSKKKAQRN